MKVTNLDWIQNIVSDPVIEIGDEVKCLESDLLRNHAGNGRDIGLIGIVKDKRAFYVNGKEIAGISVSGLAHIIPVECLKIIKKSIK